MNMPTFDRQLGDHEYQITRLTLSKWFELEGLVSRCLAPAIGELADAFTSGGGDDPLDMDLSNVIPAFKTLLMDLGPEDLNSLCTHMGSCLKFRTEEGNWERLDRSKQNIWWPTHMGEMIPVLVFFLEVQFADFFKGGASLLQK